MTILDWVLVVIWSGITLGGFFKGAVRMVFGLGGLALGIWLAVVVGPELAVTLGEWVGGGWPAAVLARVIPLVIVVLLCLLAGWGMEKTLEGLKLGCLNRLLGAVLAGAAAAVVLAVLLVSAVRLSPELAAYGERSLLLARLRSVVVIVEPEPEPPANRPQSTPEPVDSDGEPAEDGASGR